MNLYPLKFSPILKDKIWGGKLLSSTYGKPTNSRNCGESWEISTVPNDVSIVSEGKLAGKDLLELIGVFKTSLLGNKVYERYGEEFPLLIKFIDANDDLSVQVHPGDEVAQKKHNSFGKTEMWYVAEAAQDASLIAGFEKAVTPDEFRKKVEDNTVLEVLNQVPANKGDVFFIPAGRVHTIGKGLLIAEIQQTSDVTYRIYDFDRKDAEGNTRELHVEDALEALDYSVLKEPKKAYVKKSNDPYVLVECPYFQTNKIDLIGDLDVNHTDKDSFVIYMCVAGEVEIKTIGGNTTLKKGETVLVPAALKNILLTSNVDTELLEVFIP